MVESSGGATAVSSCALGEVLGIACRHVGEDSMVQTSLDPRPHYHPGKWAWYRLLAHALTIRRYLAERI